MKTPTRLRVVASAKPRRVLGYARVSSLLQASGSSLGDQQTTIRAHAAKLGVPVAHFYVEAASAHREKYELREQMQALLAAVDEGDLVLAAALDRWSRDPEFTYTSIRLILERGAAFYAIGDQCDPSTPEGDTMLNFRVLFAREEHKRIRQRTVGNRQTLRDAGYFVEGLPPYGYKRGLAKGERGPERKGTLVIEPAAAEQVRAAYRLCISGRSVRDIASETELTKDRVVSILRSRCYIGQVKDSGGQWIPGKHLPILDADTFQRAQEALQVRKLGGSRPRPVAVATSTWILRDVARCGACGARMSSAYNIRLPDGGYRRMYYRCAHTCGVHHVPVRAVESAAEPLILARLEELREELAREPERAPRSPATPVGLETRRERLRAKRQRFLDAFGDALMTRDELRTALGKVDAEVMRLDAIEAAAKRQSALADPAARRAALREVGTIRKAWANATPEAKRRIVGHLATEARLIAGAPPVFTWRSAEELAER